jgi:hypothetical protein
MKQSPRLMRLRQQVVVLLDGHRDNIVRLLLVAMKGTPFWGGGLRTQALRGIPGLSRRFGVSPY